MEGEMIIDTGASVTVLDRKLFAAKAVDEGEEEVRMQSGSVTGQIEDVQLIHLDTLRIGGTEVEERQDGGYRPGLCERNVPQAPFPADHRTAGKRFLCAVWGLHRLS